MPPARSTPEQGAARILVVEDDHQLARLLNEQLRLAGHVATLATTLAEARDLLAAEQYDLVLLDLNLPDGDGLDLATEVAEAGSAQVLMLTARSDVNSRVAGLYAGAHDYLTKPFSVPELLARVHVRLRERGLQALLTYHDLVLDRRLLACTLHGEVLHLPELEFELLRLLVQYRGRVFSREDLERSLYGPYLPDSNTVEVFVYNLRRKLKSLGLESVIRTVRNRGYVVV